MHDDCLRNSLAAVAVVQYKFQILAVEINFQELALSYMENK